MSDIFLGIEIGGTKLQAGLGDGAGTITQLSRVSVAPEKGHEGILEQLEALVGGLLDRREANDSAAGIGVGFGGPVDAARGSVTVSNQVSGWSGFPLVDWTENKFGIPTVLANDSDMAGLAEAHFGAGRGHDIVVYMNIGSGIGGAIVCHGVLHGQGRPGSAEIGQLRVLPGEPGQPWRTLESLCSGWRLQDTARQAAAKEPTSLLYSLVAGRLDSINTETLVEAVRRGDPAAHSIWLEAIDLAGVALANVIALLCPSVIVLGGGVALAGETLLESLRAAVDRQVFPPFRGAYEIVPAALGEAVVVHGALKWARDSRAGNWISHKIPRKEIKGHER